MRPCLAFVLGLGLLAPAAIQAQQAATLGPPAAAASTPPTTFRAAPPSPDPLVGDYIPAARLGPISEVRTSNAPFADPAGTPEERYNCGLPDAQPPAPQAPQAPDSPFWLPAPAPAAAPTPAPRLGASAADTSESNFGEQFNDMLKGGPPPDWVHFNNFESDHCFDTFISPVSNPFLNEDPRTLTELRPIFLYQTIPGNQSYYHGGNIENFDLQGRLALTDRLSLVLDKLGMIVINPGSTSYVSSESGITELWFGPKYTWYRDPDAGIVAAGGLQFQVPIGPAKVFQDTGDLSLVPYANVALQFEKTSYGTFHFEDTFGIAFSTNGERSNYFYDSAHVDFDVANWQHVYPLVELNWFHYTQNGDGHDLGFEGFDLANVGSAVAGHDFLSVAFGSRFKVSESVQFGVAAELPLAGVRDLDSFRFTVDMIWRY